MDSNALNALGLCRRANKLSMGHDMCKSAVTFKKAKICLISSDSSERVYNEFNSLCEGYKIPLYRIDMKIDEIHHHIGYKAGIMTIDDSGFAKLFLKHFSKGGMTI